jgi:hypothetical protein
MRTAIEDLRAMADQIMKYVADRGAQWEQPGTPERLLIDAASLMTGVANGLEHVGVDLGRGEGRR